jgi:hypothetical protein
MMLYVLDLMAGEGGWSQAFRDRGWKVHTLDFDPVYNTTYITDIREFRKEHALVEYDFITASPPCQGFTVMRMGRNWHAATATTPPLPKTPVAENSMMLATEVRRVIEELNPRLGFVIENPVGMLRTLPLYADLRNQIVHYCQYGRSQRKPTDLWMGGPVGDSITLLPSCDAFDAEESVWIDDVEWRVSPRYGRPCHQAARRGSHSGVEGQESRLHRTEVPYNLSYMFAEHAERVAGESPLDPPDIDMMFDWEDDDDAA